MIAKPQIKVRMLLAPLAAFALGLRATGQEPAIQPGAAAPSSFQIAVDASRQWVDTNVDLRAEDSLHFAASGEVTYPEQGKSKEKTFGPDGLARSFADVIHPYAVTDAGHGALIGRVGPADAAQPFVIGTAKDYSAPVAGRLFLGINQSAKDASSAHGSFLVTITVTNPGTSTRAMAEAGGPAESAIPAITPALIERIPRRVADLNGNAGDMVNVLIVGSEDELVQAFTAAGWVKVDKSVETTVITGILDTLAKKNYVTLPMSTLYLFSRAQDYGFAHAEPVRVAMSRHHLRAWKSPYEVDGRPLWCISATHDVGFERDQRNNSITHKIDPAIDGEREYVSATLSGTGLVTQRTHVTSATPLTEATTATGSSFHSDGRILVLLLKAGPGS